MNNASSPTTSETDWARIDALQRPLKVLLDDNIADYFMAQSNDRTYHQLINTALSELGSGVGDQLRKSLL